jgi:hypothetical protein
VTVFLLATTQDPATSVVVEIKKRVGLKIYFHLKTPQTHCITFENHLPTPKNFKITQKK